MRKTTFLAVAFALALAACGGHDDPEYGQITPDMPGGFALPEPKEAVPSFALLSKEGFSEDEVRSVQRLDHVTAATPLKVAEVEIDGPAGTETMQLGSAPPLKFRSVSPAVTRDADFVWTSLIGGQAVVTYEAAQKLGVLGAEKLGIPSLGKVQVGAFAENGTPSNFADVLVSDHIVDRMPGEPIEILVVGADEGGDVIRLARSLKGAIPDARIMPLVQVLGDSVGPSDSVPQPVARGTAEAGLGGTMQFTVLEDGWIEPDEAWVEANLLETQVPILGTVVCHRVMIPQLAGALAEIEREGLASLIRPEDYAGCYAPRFIDRNPNLPLSNHAFGLAVDLNSDTNQLGTEGDMDPRVVEIFEKWGFEWGGGWERPDPMHFELARLLPQ